MVLGSNQSGEDRDATPRDGEIVVAAAKCDTAHLHHPQTSSFGTVVQRTLVQRDHTVGDAVQLQIRGLRSQIVEQEHG